MESNTLLPHFQYFQSWALVILREPLDTGKAPTLPWTMGILWIPRAVPGAVWKWPGRGLLEHWTGQGVAAFGDLWNQRTVGPSIQTHSDCWVTSPWDYHRAGKNHQAVRRVETTAQRYPPATNHGMNCFSWIKSIKEQYQRAQIYSLPRWARHICAMWVCLELDNISQCEPRPNPSLFLVREWKVALRILRDRYHLAH